MWRNHRDRHHRLWSDVYPRLGSLNIPGFRGDPFQKKFAGRGRRVSFVSSETFVIEAFRAGLKYLKSNR